MIQVRERTSSGQPQHWALVYCGKYSATAERINLRYAPPDKDYQAETGDTSRLKRAVLAGAFDESEGFAELSRIKGEIEALKKKVTAEAPPDTTADEIRRFLDHLDQCWSDLEFGMKREILRTYAP